MADFLVLSSVVCLLAACLSADDSDDAGHSGPSGKSLRQLLPGVHELSIVVGERFQNQYLFVGRRSLLFDTGTPSTPGELLIPYLAKAGLSPDRLTFILNSHADGDHFGGNHAMKVNAPHAILLGVGEERELLENPDFNWQQRWCSLSRLGMEMPRQLRDDVQACYGPSVPLDLVIADGSVVRLSEDWELEVLLTPSHSPGSICLYDRKHRAIFAGDALHGKYCPTVDGRPALPPIYVDVAGYLRSIARLSELNADFLHSGHWPALAGREQIDRFLAESREFVEVTAVTLWEYLSRNPEGRTLEEICSHMNARLRCWPDSADYLFGFSVLAHLEDFEKRGQAERFERGRQTCWRPRA